MIDWPPRVLSNLYKSRLQTFYDLLAGLITKSLRFVEERRGVEPDGGAGDEDRRLQAAKLQKQGEYVALFMGLHANVNGVDMDSIALSDLGHQS